MTPVRLEPAALRSRVKQSLPLSHCAPNELWVSCQVNMKPFGLQLLCKRLEVFMIPLTDQILNLYLKRTNVRVASLTANFWPKINVDMPILYGPRREKTCLRGFGNNKGADQTAHLRSLISSFVIRFLKSIICKLASGELSIF